VPWEATAEPERFDEAVDWFRDRFPLTPDLAAKLGSYAGARAWTIAGVGQLDVVLHTYDSLLKAIDKGTPFEEWKGEVEESLTSAWGSPDSFRIETIFRNATQQSLNAGRWRAMRDPDVKDLRPFVLFDGIDDANQSEICEKIDGTIVKVDDPWLLTHSPQLHHRCRSQLVSLRETDAAARGITKDLPDTKADTGFGKPPDDSATPWKPDPKDYPPELFKVYEQKATPTEGVHFKRLESNLSKKNEAAALGALADNGMLPYLEKQPLEGLALKRKLARGVAGQYSQSGKVVAVQGARDAHTFGQTFEAGKSWSVSSAAKTAIEATQRTLIHEVAHHIHLGTTQTGRDMDVGFAIEDAWLDPKKKPITEYAAVNPTEYFAESFAAFKFHRAEFREHDPVGFTMVEKVLALRGIAL
jgi:SPP1 gp7 family putative phage head morphogenesis protein